MSLELRHDKRVMQSCSSSRATARLGWADTSRPGPSSSLVALHSGRQPVPNWLAVGGHGPAGQIKAVGDGASLSWQFGEIETGEGPGFGHGPRRPDDCSRPARHLS